MEGALVVIPLVGLVLPILMLLAALVFDAAIALWAIYEALHRPSARLWRFAKRPGNRFHWSTRPLAHGSTHR